ncbi:hypothetical protein NSQ95_10890 [Psychrobacillus sp. FSL W7-1457]|uniref:hypothetical protein n=1 Tax=unclassified Psychrobacillus TaxID=2636677 RepID=UPI0030F92610
MIARQIKALSLFMGLIIILVIAKGLWNNNEVDWGEILFIIIASLIGGAIGVAGAFITKKLLKKRES